MKRFILLTLMACLLTACYTDKDYKQLQQDCKALSAQKQTLQSQVNSLNSQISGLSKRVSDLRNEQKARQNGKEPKYIVKFKIKQGTFTLDLFEHAKNEMNAIEVELPVNRDFYNRLSIGQDLTDSFKWGSLVMDGDFSTLHMRVVGKRIE